MRERQMRELVERFLGRQMRKTMMPAALGLGLALADCRSQIPPEAGPRGGVPAGSDEVEGDLQRPDGIPIYSSPGPRRLVTNKYDKLREYGARTWAAVNQCDFAFVRAAIVNRGELASVSADVPPDEQAYGRTVDAWLEKLKRDFCTPAPAQVPPASDETPEPQPEQPLARSVRQIGAVEVQDVLFLAAGTPWKRQVAIGLVTAYVFPAGEYRRRPERKTPPLTFLDVEGRWRLLAR